MAAQPKTLQELDARDIKRALGYSKAARVSLGGILDEDPENLKKGLEFLKSHTKELNKQLEIIQAIEKYVGKHRFKNQKEINDLLKKEKRLLQDRLEIESQIDELDKDRSKKIRLANIALDAGNRLLDRTLATNKEIFKISHQMQLDSNVTWKTYSALYKGAYENVRAVNKEIGQSINNVKDLINTQNKLLGEGWRNIDTRVLTNVSTSVMLMTRTLGAFPVELSTAFQQSYRVLGDRTNEFVNSLGNRLNAFSNTFGISLGMMTGLVSKMMASNNFIARNNMQAQVTANESLIKAASLAAMVGFTTTDFIAQMSRTAQYGTMEEMATIYQGGALLQGFDTSKFQQNLIGQNYEAATKDLFQGIYDTLNNIDDHYLRAEYMQKIGGAFGLSQDELLQIMTNGANLSAYSADIQDKLVNVNTSMLDELAGVRMTIADKFDNFVDNSLASQKVGKLLQDTGMYGISSRLDWIAAEISVIIGQTSLRQGLLNKLFSGKSAAAGLSAGATTAAGYTVEGPMAIGGVSGSSMLASPLLGLGIGLGGNLLGRGLQGNTNIKSNALANIGGGLLNIGTGALGGAMIGGPIGAAIGATIGIVNTIAGAGKRKAALEEIDAQERAARAANQVSSFVETGDPVVDAINAQTEMLVNVLKGNAEENKKLIVTYESAKKITTMP